MGTKLMIEMVCKIAKALNDEGILWAIGGSFVLQAYGLVEEVHDLDLLIASQDIDRASLVLDRIALRQAIPVKAEYHTQYFMVYELDGLAIDVMANFRIQHSMGIYNFPFDASSISKHLTYKGIQLPLSSLEDWLVAYDLMVGRSQKVRLIETYLTHKGLAHPELLRRTLDQPLPQATQARVEALLKTHSTEVS